MNYPLALLLASLSVALLERLRPARPDQPALRRGLGTDMVYLLFNGHFLGVGLGWIAARTLDPALVWLGTWPGTWPGAWFAADPSWTAALTGVVAGWPLPVQMAVVVVVLDGVQWMIHRALHRYAWLWEFHKIHHSIQDGQMDWVMSFRFHWGEVVVYRALQYLPLALAGFGAEALFFHAVLGTVIGHLNHANVRLPGGRWRYLLNSPEMHLWHHSADGPARNFGIILSVWDWLAGTAHLPDHPPARLGYDGQAELREGFLWRSLWPLWLLRSPRGPGG